MGRAYRAALRHHTGQSCVPHLTNPNQNFLRNPNARSRHSSRPVRSTSATFPRKISLFQALSTLFNPHHLPAISFCLCQWRARRSGQPGDTTAAQASAERVLRRQSVANKLTSYCQHRRHISSLWRTYFQSTYDSGRVVSQILALRNASSRSSAYNSHHFANPQSGVAPQALFVVTLRIMCGISCRVCFYVVQHPSSARRETPSPARA